MLSSTSFFFERNKICKQKLKNGSSALKKKLAANRIYSIGNVDVHKNRKLTESHCLPIKLPNKFRSIHELIQNGARKNISTLM